MPATHLKSNLCKWKIRGWNECWNLWKNVFINTFLWPQKRKSCSVCLWPSDSISIHVVCHVSLLSMSFRCISASLAVTKVDLGHSVLHKLYIIPQSCWKVPKKNVLICCFNFFSHWFLVLCIVRSYSQGWALHCLSCFLLPKFIYPGLTTRTLSQC